MQQTDISFYRYAIGILLLILSVFPPFDAAAIELTPQEERGRHIYLTGESASGEPLTAFFGEERINIPATSSPCASCHGHDGTGRPESGLIPSNITWPYLIKSYGHRHPNGVVHPPFNETTLKAYLRDGNYPGGAGSSDPSMPLYDMPEQDLDDLVSYLRRLGTLNPPGVTDSTIRIGSFLPLDGPQARLGRTIETTLLGYFSRVNALGGVYGRKLQLVVFPLPADGSFPRGEISRWLAEQAPFVLLNPVVTDPETDLHTLLNANQIPAISPVSLFAQTSYANDRLSFQLFSGVSDQVSALLKFKAKQVADSRPLVSAVFASHTHMTAVQNAIAETLKELNWPALQLIPFEQEDLASGKTVEKLKRLGSELVVFLGGEREGNLLLTGLVQENWPGSILSPGVLSGRIIQTAPADFAGRLHLSYVSLPSDRQQHEMNKLTALFSSPLLREQFQTSILAYTSSKILVEALRQAGKQVDQQILIDNLEKLYNFQTGLTRPITFSKNSHIGTRGAYIITFNGSNAPLAAVWTELK